RLRDKLRELGVAPAPVLLCLARERVILKDLRFPKVPDAEEPALIRFQASKDLTENPDDVRIDYQVLGPTPQGDQQAVAVILRREVRVACQALCGAAGLKLAGVTPRPYGMAGLLERAAEQPAAGVPVALLAMGPRSAELCIIQDRVVRFARALPL